MADSQTISVPTKSLDMNAALFVPPAGESGQKYPAIVLLHDLHGLDETIQNAATRLTAEGYIVLVPDLFAHAGGPPSESGDETALIKFTQDVSDARMVSDTLAALGTLAAHEGVDRKRLGVVGFGWGGAYALMAAAHDGRIRAAVDIAGAITYPVLTVQKPGSPLNFVADLEGILFAAFPSNDPLIPINEVERLRARLVEHDKRGDVKVYPDTPARFWRDAYLPQTEALWRRLTHFLHDNLAAPDPVDVPVDYPTLGQPDIGYPNEESRIHA